MPLYYHKTDSLKWLTGSIRQDLIPDERSVWADLMALAGITREGRRGFIERSQGIPYEKVWILNFLNIPEELFDRTVEKCVKEGRLQVFPDGTMLLTNWTRYNDMTEFDDRKAAKRAGIEKAKRNRKSTEDSIMVLIRQLNDLNKRLGKMRYVIQDGGEILDTLTGQLVQYKDIEGVDDKS